MKQKPQLSVIGVCAGFSGAGGLWASSLNSSDVQNAWNPGFLASGGGIGRYFGTPR